MNEKSDDLTEPDAAELENVLKQLTAAQKILRRDWPHLSARDRSSQSRRVKQLEERRQALLEAIEMKGE